MMKEIVVVSARIFNGAPFSTGQHAGTITNDVPATVNFCETPDNIHNAVQQISLQQLPSPQQLASMSLVENSTNQWNHLSHVVIDELEKNIYD